MANNKLKNFNNYNLLHFAKFILEFLSPILYAFFWLVLLFVTSLWIPEQVILKDQFIPFLTIVYLFTLIIKSTSWAIGHEKFGIKGDSRSRVINYHRGETGEKSVWFDLFADNPNLLNNEGIRNFIKELKKIG